MAAFDRCSPASPRRRAALVAGSVAALVPPVVLFGNRLGSDALTGAAVGLLLGISVLALIRSRDRV